MFPYVPDENVLGDEEEGKKKGSYVLNIACLHATCSLSRIFLQNKEIILVWYDAVLIEPLGQWLSLLYFRYMQTGCVQFVPEFSRFSRFYQK